MQWQNAAHVCTCELVALLWLSHAQAPGGAVYQAYSVYRGCSHIVGQVPRTKQVLKQQKDAVCGPSPSKQSHLRRHRRTRCHYKRKLQAVSFLERDVSTCTAMSWASQGGHLDA